MGSALSTHSPTAVVSIDAYVAELLEFTYIGDMGRARFLKTVKTLHREGEAVAKVFIRPSLEFDLSAQEKILNQYQNVLADIPNAIGYARIIVNARAGYLIRQHIKHNLYDRISTRPFLEDIEKLWIIFQLLKVLQDAHTHDIYHGDIKAENVLVSSWKWVYLSDWAPYKPVTLPETDSSDFLFYFNTSGRRVCYVSPERFTSSGAGPRELDGAMDIYSMGCVFAELLMEKPLFSLADSFKYKRGEFEPALDIQGPMREMISSMISINPDDRPTADGLFEKYRDVIFPSYFWNLYDLVEPFSRSKQNNSSDMLNHLFEKFDDIIEMLDLDVGPQQAPVNILPVLVTTKKRCWAPQPSDLNDGALIVLAIVCSQLVSTVDISSRLRSCDLMLALSAFVPDEIKLNRTLPYFASLLKDPIDSVQVAAVSTITQLLDMTSELSSLNEKVFTEYLLPRLRGSILLPTTSHRVKAVYAACLPNLAEAAYRLEPQSDESLALHIESNVRSILTEKNSLVRRAVLNNFDSLCARMGRHQTNDIFLSHTVTYLNDKDVHVRKDFFSFIARIGPLVGPASLEQYVIPLMMQSLVDFREDVVSTVVASLASLVELSLVRQKVLWTILPQLVKFFIHPNTYIRTRIFLLFAGAAKWMTPAQIYCLFKPMIEQVFQGEITDFSDHRSYIAAVRPPMQVSVYNLTMIWASENAKSSFLSSQANSNIVFSQEDKRWMERLREVGFNNEDLWQLVLYRQYMLQVVASKKETVYNDHVENKAMPQTWTEGEIPTGLEQYITRKVSSEGGSVDADLHKRFSSLKFSGQSVEQSQSSTEERYFSGTLVTSAKAHRGAVTSLAICGNQKFFVTGADDKLIRVWDSKSICKGTPRPIHSREFKAPVKCVEFFKNRSAFVVGTEDGELNFVELSYSKTETGISYGPLTITETRKFATGYAVAVMQVKDNLLVLKSNCTIFILNLVTLYTSELQNPVEHGPPTCWCFDKDYDWVAIGTSHGVIDVWDLRFNLLVQTWGVGTLQPINTLQLHPRAPFRWIVVGGGFDREYISTWDIQNGECREVLIPSSEDDTPFLEPILEPRLSEKLAARGLKESFGTKRAAMALYAGSDLAAKNQYLISGGTDRILRYWDLQAPQKCKVISGLSHDHSGMTYSSRIGSTVRATQEKVGTVKFKPSRKPRLSIIQSEEMDVGRNHRGTITQVRVLDTQQRSLVASVDQVGYLKIYL